MDVNSSNLSSQTHDQVVVTIRGDQNPEGLVPVEVGSGTRLGG